MPSPLEDLDNLRAGQRPIAAAWPGIRRNMSVFGSLRMPIAPFQEKQLEDPGSRFGNMENTEELCASRFSTQVANDVEWGLLLGSVKKFCGIRSRPGVTCEWSTSVARTYADLKPSGETAQEYQGS